MTLYGVVQNVIISMVVLLSVLYILRKLMPKWIRGKQLALATMLNQPSRMLVLRKLGSFMTPGEASAGGCGSGCSSCSSCDSAPEAAPAETEEKPLKFQRHI
jgi:hypothetical protein